MQVKTRTTEYSSVFGEGKSPPHHSLYQPWEQLASNWWKSVAMQTCKDFLVWK